MIELTQEKFEKYLYDKLKCTRVLKNLTIELDFDYENEIDALSLYLERKNPISENEFDKIAKELNKNKIVIFGHIVDANSRETFIRIDLIKLSEDVIKSEVKVQLEKILVKNKIDVESIEFDLEEEDSAFSVYFNQEDELNKLERKLNRMEIEIGGFSLTFWDHGRYLKGRLSPPYLLNLEDFSIDISKIIAEIETGVKEYQKTRNDEQLKQIAFDFKENFHELFTELIEDEIFYQNYYLRARSGKNSWLLYYVDGIVYFKLIPMIKDDINEKKGSKLTPKNSSFLTIVGKIDPDDDDDDAYEVWLDFYDRLFDRLPIVKENSIRSIVGYS